MIHKSSEISLRKIGVLGPQFSYSHIACLKLEKNHKAEIVFYNNIYDIFEDVKNLKLSSGLVPVENLIHGNVRETFFALKKNNVQINLAYDMKIEHCLAAKNDGFKVISSHPQALGQCSNFIKKSGLATQETSSTAYAMTLAAENESTAAIGSTYAANNYKLKILKENIGDNKNNKTRFFLISNNQIKITASTKKNIKTSMILTPQYDRPGLLFEILAIFKIKNINLSKIESIPSGNKLGEYCFYIDIDGSKEDKNVKEALTFLSTIVEVEDYGSYEVI